LTRICNKRSNNAIISDAFIDTVATLLWSR